MAGVQTRRRVKTGPISVDAPVVATDSVKTLERRLASDERAGRYARTKARESYRELVRTAWLPLSTLAVGILSAFGLAATFADGPGQRGFALGFGVAAAAGTTVNLVLTASGAAPLIMGEQAEQWTAQELRVLLAHGWELVNHVSLDGYGDIDHVLVGPGGVFAIETKWSASAWRERDSRLLGGLRYAEAKAKQLELWHDVRRHGRPAVTPVLVLWGKAAHSFKDAQGARKRAGSGTLVLAGSELQAWALRQSRGVVTPAQINGVWSALAAQSEHTDRRDPIIPMSLAKLAMTSFLAVAAGLVTFLVLLQLAVFTHSPFVGLAGAASLLLGCWRLRGRERARAYGKAAGTGALCAVPVFLTDAATALL